MWPEKQTWRRLRCRLSVAKCSRITLEASQYSELHPHPTAETRARLGATYPTTHPILWGRKFSLVSPETPTFLALWLCPPRR